MLILIILFLFQQILFAQERVILSNLIAEAKIIETEIEKISGIENLMEKNND
jgi:hypothetical protein